MTKTLAERVKDLETRAAAVDPDLSSAVAADSPEPAMPSDGPNRLTIFVPEHNTTFSMGEKAADWNTSAGIVGVTQPNVFFETKDAPRTAESLGTAGKGGTSLLPAGTTGYMLATAGSIFRHAKHQLYFTSAGGDMVASSDAGAKAAVLQADEGKLEINGGGGVGISSANTIILNAESFTPHQPVYGANANTTYTLQDKPDGSLSEDCGTWGDRIQSCVDFALGFVPGWGGKAMKPGREGYSPSIGAQAAGAVKIAASFAATGDQSVGLRANNDVGLGGFVAAAIGGSIGAGVTGTFAAAMGSVCQAVGLAYSCVWGAIMAEMTSKKVIINSGADVGISSLKQTSIVADAHAGFHAGTDIQMNAESDEAVMYGGECFVGTSGDYGLVSTADEIYFGAMVGTNFGKGSSGERFVEMNASHVLMRGKADDHKLELTSSEATLQYGKSKVSLGAAAVQLEGDGEVLFKPG